MKFVGVVTILIGTATAFGDTIAVPGDAATIQGAVDIAASGDVIVLSDGVYSGDGNVNVNITKSLTLRSTNGAATCTIDCESQPMTRALSVAVAIDLTVEGIRFINGSMTDNTNEDFGGGAIECRDGSLAIDDCVFDACISEVGGAVHLSNASGVITNTFFQGNRTTLSSGVPGGGAIAAITSTLDVTACDFLSNVGSHGGAVACQIGSTASISDCTFDDNASGSRGGAVAIVDSDAHFAEVTFFDNVCLEGPGGGLYLNGGHQVVEHCVFDDNIAFGDGGGGMYVLNSTHVIDRCSFLNNRVFSDEGSGGGLRLWNGQDGSVSNSVFHGNQAGGAVSLRTAQAIFTNCTVTGNPAGGIAVEFSSGSANVHNSIIWDNGPHELSGPNTTAHHSCIKNGHPGVGNTSADPMFMSPTDLRLQWGSPGIDAGNNSSVLGSDEFDQAGAPRFRDVLGADDCPHAPGTCGTTPIVDMGALEACPLDFDGDGQANLPDLSALLSQWGTPGSMDLDGDGSVGIGDLLFLIGAWGTCG